MAAVPRSPTKSFYSTASSSTIPQRDNETPQEYYSSLLQRAAALSNISEDATTSQLSEERMTKLRSGVVDAFDKAKGERANGLWSAIPRILRLQCTAAHHPGRYMRTRTRTSTLSTTLPSPSSPFILAETDEEWEAWVAKREKAKRVESWSRNVAEQAEPLEPKSEEPSKAQRLARKNAANTKKAASKEGTLGFPVVKRASLQASAKGKAPVLAFSQPAALPEPTSSAPRPESPAPAPRTRTSPFREPAPPQSSGEQCPILAKTKSINDIPSSDYFPPSFPSQLMTSTPPINKQKLSPIPVVPPTSSLELSSSLPEAVTSANKRKRVDEDTEHTADTRPSKSVKTAQISATPKTSPRKLGGLPTLTELLKRDSESPVRRRATPQKPLIRRMSTKPLFPTSPMHLDLEPPPLPLPPVSPAKSMSSIADSDSSDSEGEGDLPQPGNFTHNLDEFAPCVTSTQQDGPHAKELPDFFAAPSQPDSFGLGYNSQAVDVEHSIDKVSHFLDMDMDMDFGVGDVPEKERQRSASTGIGGWFK